MSNPVISNSYVGDGSTVLYSFTFPYIETADLRVSLDAVETTSYILANATTIQLNTAPATGVAIKIFRVTNDSDIKSVFFPGSAVRARDLNDNFTQSLFTVQEARVVSDAAKTQSEAAEVSAGIANTNATAAAASAATATQQATASAASSASALAASQQASTDATAAQASSTASAASSAQAASDAAQAATDSASALTTSQSAVNTANASNTTSTNAVNTANTAIGRVNTYLHDGTNPVGDGVGSNPQGLAYALNQVANANSTAASAVVSAANANTTSANALSTVGTYVHDGTNPAGDGVGSNPQGLAYAINQANTAISTSNAASAAVSNAVLFTLVANVAAIPSSPSNNDYVEIGNSTGIESFTPFTGLPSGFIGHPGLTVRIRYDTPTTSWVFMSYYANDSESRYVSQDNTSANLPTGTTVQRPSSPAAGMLRFNSTDSKFEGYDGTDWGEIGGGIVTIDAGNFNTGASLVSITESYDGGSFD